MKSLVFVCAALLAVLCLVSCSNEGTPTNTSQDVELEQVGSESPPAQSGPFVIRYEGNYWVLIWDFKRNMSVIIGMNVWDFCDGIYEFDPIYIQDVTERNDQEAINQIFHGENMQVTVWPFIFFNCGQLEGAEPLAVGQVDLRATDNDYFAWMHEDPKRMNAFGVMAHGIVETADGHTGLLATHWRQVWRAGEGVYVDNEKITLALVGGPNP